MDELIYQFLLRAGYPRAAIVADPTLLTPGRDQPAPEDATSFVIVDPQTADPLAAIDVVEGGNGESLELAAGRVASYARRLGGRDLQGFVIRVDPRGRTDVEQVQFYSVWPAPLTRQLSAKTFPDLDTLRVARQLALRTVPSESAPAEAATEAELGGRAAHAHPRIGLRVYLPALLLLLLVASDWLLEVRHGVELLTLPRTLLAIGVAALLTVAAIARASDD